MKKQDKQKQIIKKLIEATIDCNDIVGEWKIDMVKLIEIDKNLCENIYDEFKKNEKKQKNKEKNTRIN